MLYSSPNFKISAFCKQWAICSQGLQAKKYSNLLQNHSPNSTHKPKPPTWYAAVMPTCRTETGPEQGDLQKNGRLRTCTHKGRYRLWLTGAGVRTLVLQIQLGERKQDKLPLTASTCFQARMPPPHRGKAVKSPWVAPAGLSMQRKKKCGPATLAPSTPCSGRIMALRRGHHGRVAAAALVPPCWMGTILHAYGVQK